jgi:hypothetical protein
VGSWRPPPARLAAPPAHAGAGSSTSPGFQPTSENQRTITVFPPTVRAGSTPKSMMSRSPMRSVGCSTITSTPASVVTSIV